jgi:hypothetical protein
MATQSVRRAPSAGNERICVIRRRRREVLESATYALSTRSQDHLGSLFAGSSCRPGLLRRHTELPGSSGFGAGILHARFMRRLALSALPVRPEKSDGLDRIQPAIVHPMVRLAHECEVIGIVVAALVVEMRNGHASRNLQPADNAAADRIRCRRNPPRFALPAHKQV